MNGCNFHTKNYTSSFQLLATALCTFIPNFLRFPIKPFVAIYIAFLYKRISQWFTVTFVCILLAMFCMASNGISTNGNERNRFFFAYKKYATVVGVGH